MPSSFYSVACLLALLCSLHLYRSHFLHTRRPPHPSLPSPPGCLYDTYGNGWCLLVRYLFSPTGYAVIGSRSGGQPIHLPARMPNLRLHTCVCVRVCVCISNISHHLQQASSASPDGIPPSRLSPPMRCPMPRGDKQVGRT